jgi:hypothetical protein
MKTGQLVLPFLALALASGANDPAAKVERRFTELRNSPPELYAFLLRMPKGGDLHNHLGGDVYAESLVEAAAEDSLCVDERAMSLVRQCGADAVKATRARADNRLFNSLVDSLSMRDFVAGRESNHDHFFNTFDKFSAISHQHDGEFVAEVVRRAAEQNESYLELMALAGGGAVSALGKTIGFDGNFERTAAKLRSGGLSELAATLRSHVDQMEEQRRKRLQCNENPDSPPCTVIVRYIYQVLREFPTEQVFAQVLAGFMLASADPRVVAVNLVQPEDGQTSMRDYHLHMQMVDFAKHFYPNVHVALHAGELASGLVPPDFQLPTNPGQFRSNYEETTVKCRQDAKTKMGRIVSGYSGGRSVFLRRSRGGISRGGSWGLPVSGCQAGPAVSEARAAARDSARSVHSTCLPGLDQHQGCVPFPFEPESERGTDIVRAFPSDSRSSGCGGWSDPDSA